MLVKLSPENGIDQLKIRFWLCSHLHSGSWKVSSLFYEGSSINDVTQYCRFRNSLFYRIVEKMFYKMTFFLHAKICTHDFVKLSLISFTQGGSPIAFLFPHRIHHFVKFFSLPFSFWKPKIYRISINQFPKVRGSAGSVNGLHRNIWLSSYWCNSITVIIVKAILTSRVLVCYFTILAFLFQI